MPPYFVKSLFLTLQGEGAQAGRAAVFCRFAGCNLWSGREEDRDRAVCQFCDTDFLGTDGPAGGRYASADELAERIAAAWRWTDRPVRGQPCVVFTGGEPALQLDAGLVDAVRERGFATAIETNGTLALPDQLDWICVSPKAGSDLLIRQGDELKLVYPQVGAEPERFESLAFRHFFLQPMDGPDREQNTQRAIEYVLGHPHWRLGLQTHKWLGLP